MMSRVPTASSTRPTGSKSARLRVCGSASVPDPTHALFGSQKRPRMIAVRAIGTLMRNAERQPHSSPSTAMSPPPRTGPMPTETPTIVPNIPKARPRTLPWKYCWSIPTPCGLSSPEPTPMTTRAMLRISGSGESPAMRDPSAKTLTPRTKKASGRRGHRHGPPRRGTPRRPACSRRAPIGSPSSRHRSSAAYRAG